MFINILHLLTINMEIFFIFDYILPNSSLGFGFKRVSLRRCPFFFISLRKLKHKNDMIYQTDKEIKSKIDKLLEQNCSNVANSDTRSQNDIGGDDEVQWAWEKIQQRIKELDPVFYEVIKSR